MDDLLTTRQLQDLLRVDRITIYRMLKDGRLRGFKVGGQWRFSRREIEAWLLEQQTGLSQVPTPSLPIGNSPPVSQALPMTCIQAIQAVCAEALDMVVVTTRLDGTPLTSASNSCTFCSLILATEPGRLGCARSWRQQLDGQVHACHAGLACASLPVAVGGQRVALVATCQFTSPGPADTEPAWPSRMRELAASLGLAEADLRAVAGSVRVMPDDQLLRVLRVLRQVADTFSEIGHERLKLVGRLEKIAEMSRI